MTGASGQRTGKRAHFEIYFTWKHSELIKFV
ncbi:MAG: hypothetical protein JWM76_3208 [Pseudonocardiales bacterium]|nr:hypothetical protein [Pseudonocardiales bacterium]